MRNKIPSEELEQRLSNIYQKLEIPSYDRTLFDARLAALKNHHLPTWEHSIRVAVYSVEVVDAIMDNKISPSFWYLKTIEIPGVTAPKTIDYTSLFYPAIGHDFGKTKIRLELLEKRVGWNEKDTIEMRRHTAIGAEMAKSTLFEFSAYVITNVHSFDKKNLKPLLKNPEFSNRTNLLMLECASLINILDYYDAATYRLDDRHSPGISKYLNPEEVKTSILRDRSDEKEFIETLYSEGIF